MKIICPIHLCGEHAEAIRDGKAMPIAVLVYYPEKNELATVGMDTLPVEEIQAILSQFIDLNVTAK